MSRRAFLALAGGTVAVAACSSGSSSKSNDSIDPTMSAFRMEIEPYVSPAPQRFAYILTAGNGDFAGGPPTTMSVRPPGGSWTAPVPATFMADGLSPRARGVYVVHLPLTRAGNWDGRVTIAGRETVELAFTVTGHPVTPVVGAQGRSVVSPTVAKPLGTDPLCTRTDPDGRAAPCPLHTASLDQVIGKGTPVAVMFATPARCQSRYCGPVLEQLLSVQDTYASKVRLMHVEIYKNLTTSDLVAATETWLGSTGEPWLFGLDGTGKVLGRLSGAFATSEVTQLLDTLVASATPPTTTTTTTSPGSSSSSSSTTTSGNGSGSSTSSSSSSPSTSPTTSSTPPTT
jgi:hypothetical protein